MVVLYPSQIILGKMMRIPVCHAYLKLLMSLELIKQGKMRNEKPS
ncbi:MAG: hypothetical protein ABFD82_07015 [Syntrophaceae bacterium]